MTVATRKPKKVKDEPRALPPNTLAEERIERALWLVQEARAILSRDGRAEDVMQLGRFINDLQYRMIPRVRAVACSHCSGYRGESVPGGRCRHE